MSVEQPRKDNAKNKISIVWKHKNWDKNFPSKEFLN